MELRDKIMRESREALNPGGAVLVTSSPALSCPTCAATSTRLTRIFEPRNILPARLFYCTQGMA
jgi:hypothetical protein